MMMMHGIIKKNRGLSVHHVGGVCSSAAAMASRRFFHAGGGGGGGGGGGAASLVMKRDMFRAGDTLILCSGRKTRECVGGFVPHQCTISHMLPSFARPLGSSSTSQSSGQTPPQEPMESKKKEQQIIISSSKLQREKADVMSSANVSLNQFPGLMAPPRRTCYETSSEFDRRHETRRLLRLNPGTGYFEEQQDVLPVPCWDVCRGSAYGWLFVTDDDCGMKLLNPFSGAEIQLPPVETLPHLNSDDKEDRWPLSKWVVNKAVFSANPSTEPRPVVLVIYGIQIPRLAFCKPGDERWTPLELFPSEFHFHQDALYHKGQFYVLSHPGYVVAYDIGRRIDDDDHSVKTTLVTTTPPTCGKVFDESYLVVVDEELVRIELRQGCFRDCCVEWTMKEIEIERTKDGDTTVEDEGFLEKDFVPRCMANKLSPTTYCIKIQRWDVSEKQWVKVESLGDKAVFVGYNTSFVLSASDYPAGVCIPDSIYFTHGQGGTEWVNGSYDNGIYNMKDESVKKPLYLPMPNDDEDGAIGPAPIWIVNAI